jgi:hypothetical protein
VFLERTALEPHIDVAANAAKSATVCGSMNVPELEGRQLAAAVRHQLLLAGDFVLERQANDPAQIWCRTVRSLERLCACLECSRVSPRRRLRRLPAPEDA